MTDFRAGVVIPVGPGREENLRRMLDALVAQALQPETVVLVCDGTVGLPDRPDGLRPWCVTTAAKHKPGMEQPRNIGVELVGLEFSPPCTHVWFVDSDIVPDPNALQAYAAAAALNPEPHIMVGPYDWLAPDGSVERFDDRWRSFHEHDPAEILYDPIGAGLACFSGNLVWPIKEFQQIGGFWNELHHGRCEDGELGIRAVSAGIGVSFVRDAKAVHLWHDRDMTETLRRNAIDVPKINRRHPFMPDGIGPHLLMTAKDGIRFDFRCPGCSKRMNSLLYWEHCGGRNWECPDA